MIPFYHLVTVCYVSNQFTKKIGTLANTNYICNSILITVVILKVCMKVFLVGFLLLLSGCASTQLHLVTQGYTIEQVENIKNELSPLLVEYDLEIVISDILIPNHFPDASIALNPADEHRLLITKLDTWLEGAGHKVSQEFRFAEGNHYYNKGHLGFYLRKPGSEQQVQLPPYLRTQFCKLADGTLALNKNGKAILEYELNNDGSDDMTRETGKWSFIGDKLILNIADEQYTFKRVEETKETYIGPRPADVFKPIKQQEHPSIFNCEFLIIYMD